MRRAINSSLDETTRDSCDCHLQPLWPSQGRQWGPPPNQARPVRGWRPILHSETSLILALVPKRAGALAAEWSADEVPLRSTDAGHSPDWVSAERSGEQANSWQ